MPPVDALGACVWGSAACAAGCHWRRERFILAGGSCWAARPGARDQTLFCQAGLSSSHSHDGLRARRASTWPLPYAIIRQQPAFPPAHCSMQICTGQLPARAASRSADRHGEAASSQSSYRGLAWLPTQGDLDKQRAAACRAPLLPSPQDKVRAHE